MGMFVEHNSCSDPDPLARSQEYLPLLAGIQTLVDPRKEKYFNRAARCLSSVQPCRDDFRVVDDQDIITVKIIGQIVEMSALDGLS